MAWRNVTIPLLRGQSSGSADLSAVSTAQELLAASNVVFTKSGSIRPRPGLSSLDAPPTVFLPGASAQAGLANVLGTGCVPSGVHSYDDGLAQARPLLTAHGRLFARTASGWSDAGAYWSARRKTWGGAGALTGNAVQTYALDVSSFGRTGTAGPGGGFLSYDPDGTVIGESTVLTNYNAGSIDQPMSTAGNATFWADQGGSPGHIYGVFYGAFPAITKVTLVSDATTTTPQQRVWAAYDGTNYYVAYIANVGDPNPTTIKIIKVNASGTVLNTLSYTLAATLSSVCIAVDSGSGKGLLVATCSTAPRARTRVFNTSGMTDAAINVDVTPTDTAVTGAVAGISGSTGYVGWCGDPVGGGFSGPSVDVFTRSMTTNAAAVLNYTLAGTTGGALQSPYCKGWLTLFPFQVVAGRVLLGVQGFTSGTVLSVSYGPCQWAVVDVTKPADVPASAATWAVVAAGLPGGSMRTKRALSAYVSANTLVFGVAEGVTFSTSDIEKALLTPISLTLQDGPGVQLGARFLFGGNVGYTFDGRKCFETGWIEEPVLTATASNGGSLAPSASYTVQGVWEFVDGTGRVTRSVPSPVFTLSTTVTNKQIDAVISSPQLSSKSFMFDGAAEASRAKLYMSTANPSAGAPLHLVATKLIAPGPSAAFATFATVTAEPSAAAEEVYTTGNVLADDRAPSDFGFAVSQNRVWTADERTLYPSHIETSNVGTAWNLEQFAIAVPVQFGRVTGLGSIDDKVLAVCERGTVVVNGSGFDNLGQGSGWSEPERVAEVGGAEPRGVCSFPDGVAYVGRDGLLYVVSRSLVLSCLSVPVKGDAEPRTIVTYQPAAAAIGFDTTTSPCLVYGVNPHKVLDLNTGQWSEWTASSPAAQTVSFCGTPGGLVTLYSVAPYVAVWSASGGADLGVNFSMSVKSAPQETTADGAKLCGWGRVRSINPVFDTLAAHTLRVQAFADEGRVSILDNSAAMDTSALGANWPFTRLPEFRTRIQRASFFEVTLTATPAAAEWTAINCAVFGVSSQAPSRRRITLPTYTGPVDATSGWAVPLTLADWTSLVPGTGIANPTYIWPCQNASGNLVEALGTGTDLAAVSGAPLYLQGATGWTRKEVLLVSGTSDLFKTIGLGDASRLFFAIVDFPTSFPAGNPQSLMTIGVNFGQQTACNTKPSSAALLNLDDHGGATAGGTTVSGAQSVASTIRPVIVAVNTTNNTVYLVTDLESLSHSKDAGDHPNVYALGGDNVNFWFSATFGVLYAAGWQGAAAEMTLSQMTTLISKIRNGH